MADFFKKHDFSGSKILKGGKQATCISCGRYKEVTSPKMKLHEGTHDVLIINSFPTKKDDLKGSTLPIE